MRILTATLVVLLALSSTGAQRPDATAPGIDAVQHQFADPPADSRVMMRWWWFGPSASRDELDAEMRHMREGGIGGFEVATVYPLAVDDRRARFHNYPYLSPEFLDRDSHSHRVARASSACGWT